MISSCITNHFRKQLILFPLNLNVSLGLLGNNISCFARDQSFFKSLLLFPWQEEVVRDIERRHWSSDHDICQSKEGENCVSPQLIVEMTYKKRNPQKVSEDRWERGRSSHALTPSLSSFSPRGRRLKGIGWTRWAREEGGKPSRAFHVLACLTSPFPVFSAGWSSFASLFLPAVSIWDLATGYQGPLGYNRTIPESFCAGTKTIKDRASVHTQQRWFGSSFCNKRSCAMPTSSASCFYLISCDRQSGTFRL